MLATRYALPATPAEFGLCGLRVLCGEKIDLFRGAERRPSRLGVFALSSGCLIYSLRATRYSLLLAQPLTP